MRKNTMKNTIYITMKNSKKKYKKWKIQLKKKKKYNKKFEQIWNQLGANLVQLGLYMYVVVLVFYCFYVRQHVEINMYYVCMVWWHAFFCDTHNLINLIPWSLILEITHLWCQPASASPAIYIYTITVVIFEKKWLWSFLKKNDCGHFWKKMTVVIFGKKMIVVIFHPHFSLRKSERKKKYI